MKVFCVHSNNHLKSGRPFMYTQWWNKTMDVVIICCTLVLYAYYKGNICLLMANIYSIVLVSLPFLCVLKQTRHVKGFSNGNFPFIIVMTENKLYNNLRKVLKTKLVFCITIYIFCIYILLYKNISLVFKERIKMTTQNNIRQFFLILPIYGQFINRE